VDAFTNAETSITTSQDIELGQAYLQKIQTQLQEYQTRLSSAVQTFQGNLQTYQTESSVQLSR